MQKYRDRLILAGINWRPVALLMRHRIGQASALIPMIGYLLLWSEWAQETFALQDELSKGQWFSLQTRLLFIYLGAWAVTIAWLIYLLRCPTEIRRTPEKEDFISDQLQTNDLRSFHSMKAELSLCYHEGPERNNHHRDWKPNAPATLKDGEVTPNEIHTARYDNKISQPIILRARYSQCIGTNPCSAILANLIAATGVVLMAFPATETLWLVVRRVLLPALGFA